MWWINQFFPVGTQAPTNVNGFRKGANPLARASQEPLSLLESITAVELASCVPFVKIEKIDRLGLAATDVRPLMYDLIQTPRFGSAEDDFGIDTDTFAERALVSLNSVSVEFDQQYGISIHRQVTMDFTVHHPAVVFNKDSRNSWREILMEGKSFTLEYGWRGDPSIVRNPLFNGDGHITESGEVLKSTQLILLIIHSYDLQITQAGEVRVTIKASENGDLALREMRFSDAFSNTIGTGLADSQQADDIENMKALKGLLDRLVKKHGKGRDQYFLMGDILDSIVAPMVTQAGKTWGYDGVDLLLGNFNNVCGPQSSQYFGGPLAGTGIENFKVPVGVLMDELSRHYSKGRALLLQNFVTSIVNIINADTAWAAQPIGVSYQKPQVLLKSDTVQTGNGTRLVIIVHDITVGTHPFGLFDKGQNWLPLENQSKEEVFRKLGSLGVPILEFARAGTLITDANFNLQPDALLQSIQVDSAYSDRKDRVQQAKLPDVESRKGQSRNGELRIPVSILEGEIQMHGNFAMDVFGQIWVDFFGARDISGVFSIRGKTDTLEPGTFRSSFKVISEGSDPLNTRRRRSDRPKG